MDKEQVTVEYKDAFMVPWIKLYTELKIDSVIQPNYQMSSEMNSINRTREIIWERESSPDDYEVFVSMSYHYSGEHNISDTRTLKVARPVVSTAEIVKNVLKNIFIVVAIIAGIITIIVLFSNANRKKWKRRFKQLPEPMQDLSPKKRKQAWEKMNKDRKKTERQNRRVEKEKHEDDDFSLFKRKERKAPSRRPSVSLSIKQDASEELEL
jgi:hypothetical protein